MIILFYSVINILFYSIIIKCLSLWYTIIIPHVLPIMLVYVVYSCIFPTSYTFTMVI